MSYIDFHCHPGLKTYLSAFNESNRESCWKNINLRGPLELLDKLTKDILDSQSSLNQIKKGNVKIAIVGLYSIERAIITGEIKKVNNITIDLLTTSNFINKIDYKLLGSIAFHNKGYFTILKELENHILNAQNINPGYKILNSFNDIEEDKLNIIFAIEGGHSLYNEIGHYDDNEIINNIYALKNNSIKYFYFSIAHLVNNPLCNHAYGMKIINHNDFIPKGNGISDIGYRSIRRLLSNNNEHRILIDIKHMSLKSRWQYYDLLKNEYADVPIIASHAAFTGVSYTKMPIKKIEEKEGHYIVHYKKPYGLMNTAFNPSSINLYNEEISEIIESGGIIGIILDERVLGNKQTKKEDKIEFISKDEFQDLNIIPDQERYCETGVEVIKERVIRLFTFRKDIKHLCNNILYAVKTGGIKTWDHLCIGSDFDGLINAIESCRNAKKFRKLEKRLKKYLVKMANSDPSTNYYINDINLRVKALMHDNALNFIKTYFN